MTNDSIVLTALVTSLSTCAATLIPTVLFYRHRLRVEREEAHAKATTAAAALETAEAAGEVADNDAMKALTSLFQISATEAKEWMRESATMHKEVGTLSKRVVELENRVRELEQELSQVRGDKAIVDSQLISAKDEVIRLMDFGNRMQAERNDFEFGFDAALTLWRVAIKEERGDPGMVSVARDRIQAVQERRAQRLAWLKDAHPCPPPPNESPELLG